MLLLKLTLVVLISEISERALCADSGPAPSAKENENAPVTLPPKSLLDAPTSNGCYHLELPYFDDEEADIPGGFLAVNCTKSCPDGIQENVVEGYHCVANWSYLDPTTITVQEGSCKHGFCTPGESPKHRTITLVEVNGRRGRGKKGEERKEGEEEGEEEEEEGRIRNTSNKKNP
uniref:Putative secreted protein n=1 Tax=Ixodes ricinus TaxID=34613 RepID=A0A090X9I0_IXORI